MGGNHGGGFISSHDRRNYDNAFLNQKKTKWKIFKNKKNYNACKITIAVLNYKERDKDTLNTVNTI